jgi:hypothetical protein
MKIWLDYTIRIPHCTIHCPHRVFVITLGVSTGVVTRYVNCGEEGARDEKAEGGEAREEGQREGRAEAEEEAEGAGGGNGGGDGGGGEGGSGRTSSSCRRWTGGGVILHCSAFLLVKQVCDIDSTPIEVATVHIPFLSQTSIFQFCMNLIVTSAIKFI